MQGLVHVFSISLGLPFCMSLLWQYNRKALEKFVPPPPGFARKTSPEPPQTLPALDGMMKYNLLTYLPYA